MRRSEFERAVAAEFGTRAGALLADLVLPDLGSRTATEAIAGGADPRDVWLALCAETDVPLARRYGAGRDAPKRR